MSDINQDRKAFSDVLQETFGVKPEGVDAEVEVRTQRLLNDLQFLYVAAFAGNRPAIERSVEVASWCAAELSNLALWEFGLTSAIARFRTSWPVLLDLHPEYTAATVQRLRELGLGMDTPFRPLKKKTWSRKTRANAIVLTQLQSIEWLRRLPREGWQTEEQKRLAELPDLTPNSAKHWFDAIWARILARTNSSPENDPMFLPLGVHRAGGPSEWAKAGHAAGSMRTRVRDGIHASLYSAFKTIIETETKK